jgi:hypothetical protein
MANLKIIWTTGAPFSHTCREKIGYQLEREEWSVYSTHGWCTQSASLGDGYRLASEEEIRTNWHVLRSKWTAQVGDQVIIISEGNTWTNKRAVIVADLGDNVLKVKNAQGYTDILKDYNLILAPHDSVPVLIIKKVPEPSKETVSIKFLTEQQFRDKGLWNHSCPKGWNSIGEMNKYLGQSLVIPKSSIKSDGFFDYEGWTFKVTDYIITEGISPDSNTSGAIGTSEPAKRLVIKANTVAADSNSIFVNGKIYPISANSVHGSTHSTIAPINPDPLSLYEQKPIILKSKPKTKLKPI